MVHKGGVWIGTSSSSPPRCSIQPTTSQGKARGLRLARPHLDGDIAAVAQCAREAGGEHGVLGARRRQALNPVLRREATTA